MWFREIDLGTVHLPPSAAVIDAVAREHIHQPLKRGAKKEKSKKKEAA